MSFVRVAEYDNWKIDYDDYTNMYRVTYFENSHFKNECLFFGYDNKKNYVVLEEQKMSDKEAIAYLKAIKNVMYDSLTQQTARDALDVAIQALEEIQQYRAIGTVEELKELKENGAFSCIELANIASSLTKLQKYQVIGTVEECREAVERMKPKQH